jgi:peptidoglycan/LPS O-acetylase OafA/YrhL
VTGERMYGLPAFPYFLFGLSGLVAVAGDVRVLRTGARAGRARLARHLWRMTFALFIAAMSFFLGQAKVIPAPIRIGPLLALPPLAALVTMLWWLRRVGGRRWVVGRGGWTAGEEVPSRSL